MPRADVQPAYMSQVAAAAYLGVSVRYFREHVTVEPYPFPGGATQPLERYRRDDLDAWADRYAPKARDAKRAS